MFTLSVFCPVIMTSAPSLIIALAEANPMPLVPPVIKAFLFNSTAVIKASSLLHYLLGAERFKPALSDITKAFRTMGSMAIGRR